MTSIDSHFSQLRLKHLLLLNLIDELKSISKAAQALNLTQPAVSSMLKELESVFHATLVDRTRQGASLTPIGILTRDRLGTAMNELQAARKANIKGHEGNHLRVGVLPIAMVELIPLTLTQLTKHSPTLSLDFFEGTAPMIINDVLENKLDCAIGHMDTANFSQASIQALRFTPLLPILLAIACNIKNPLARKKNVSLELLSQQNWVLVPKGSQTRKAFDETFVQGGLRPPAPLIESLSFFSNFHMIESTDLLTLAPLMAIQRYAKLNVIRAVNYFPWPTPPRLLLFICKQRKNTLAPIQFLQESLLTAAVAIEHAAQQHK